jgi:hypothetical protein
MNKKSPVLILNSNITVSYLATPILLGNKSHPFTRNGKRQKSMFPKSPCVVTSPGVNHGASPSSPDSTGSFTSRPWWWERCPEIYHSQSLSRVSSLLPECSCDHNCSVSMVPAFLALSCGLLINPNAQIF